MSRPADAVRHGALALAAGTVGVLVVLAVLAVPAGATTPPSPVPPESWAAELAIDGGDDQGVELVDGAVSLEPTEESGTLVLSPRRTRGVVDRVAGDATADVPSGGAVVVQARGLRRDGSWGPWVTVPREGTVALGAPSTELAVRVLLRRTTGGTSPVLRGLWLTTSADPASPPSTTTTTRPTSTTTPPTTTTTTPTSTTTTTTTTPPTSTTTTPPTTTTTTPVPTTTTTTPPPSTTTAGPTTTTTTPPPSTTTTTTTTEPTTTTTTTTTTPVPPVALVPGLPLPALPLPAAAPAPDPGPRSWWGAELLDWLARSI
jgi:hypothetical protein